MSAPILVTGSHRSGTTWVGRALSLSGQAHVIHEPFNPTYYRSWLSQPPPHWFEHVTDGNAERWQDDVTRILGLRPPTRSMLARAATPKQVGMVAREHLGAAAARARKRRPLLKDPIAFFAAEWLAARHGCQPVVLIRHPAAFAGSLKRLDWQFDFRNLLDQPTLMADLADFRPDIEAAAKEPGDVVDQASLLWRIFAHVTLRYRDAHPEWQVWRYEDIAGDPLDAFERLHDALGLTWSEGVALAIEELSSPRNPAEPGPGDKGGVARDSEAAMWTWRRRLTADEAHRVATATREPAEALGYQPFE